MTPSTVVVVVVVVVVAVVVVVVVIPHRVHLPLIEVIKLHVVQLEQILSEEQNISSGQ